MEKLKLKKKRLVETHEHDLAIQETIKGLKEGIFENPKELKSNIKAVCELLGSLGAEEGLMKTLPQILRCKPSERGSFDEVALQTLDWCLSNHLSTLSGNVEAADAIVAEHATATTAWEAAIEVAEDKKRESQEALQAAETQQEKLQEALTCARKVVKEQTARVKTCKTTLATQELGFQNIEAVREALEFLQDYVAPAPAPEEEESKEPEQMAAESAETPVEMPIDQACIDDTEKKHVYKAKEIEVHMNLEDVPSPTKKARQSLGANIPMVVA